MINKYLQDVFFGVLGTVVILMLFAYILMYSAIPEQKVILASLEYMGNNNADNDEILDNYITNSFVSFGLNSRYIDNGTNSRNAWTFYDYGMSGIDSAKSVLFISDTLEFNDVIQISSENALSLSTPRTNNLDSVKLILETFIGSSISKKSVALPISSILEAHSQMLLLDKETIYPIYQFKIKRLNNKTFDIEQIN